MPQGLGLRVFDFRLSSNIPSSRCKSAWLVALYPQAQEVFRGRGDKECGRNMGGVKALCFIASRMFVYHVGFGTQGFRCLDLISVWRGVYFMFMWVITLAALVTRAFFHNQEATQCMAYCTSALLQDSHCWGLGQEIRRSRCFLMRVAFDRIFSSPPDLTWTLA